LKKDIFKKIFLIKQRQQARYGIKNPISGFFYLFWFCLLITVSSIVLLLFNNDTLSKISIGLAIAGLGMSMSWICSTMCNNTKNELAAEIFQKEIKMQLDRIENQLHNQE